MQRLITYFNCRILYVLSIATVISHSLNMVQMYCINNHTRVYIYVCVCVYTVPSVGVITNNLQTRQQRLPQLCTCPFSPTHVLLCDCSDLHSESKTMTRIEVTGKGERKSVEGKTHKCHLVGGKLQTAQHKICRQFMLVVYKQ